MVRFVCIFHFNSNLKPLFVADDDNNYKKKKNDNEAAFKGPKWQHVFLTFKFFVFMFTLPAVDMATDVLTAKDFFENGHPNWGFFSTLPIFAPFVARDQ